MLKKHINLYLIAISAFFALIISGAYVVGIPLLDVIELRLVDVRFETRDKTVPRSDIVIAAIDEKSIAEEGKWPWPRSKFSDLINRLSAAGAKVIAFDVGFLEPDDKEIIQTIENIQNATQEFGIQNTNIQNYLEKLKTNADNDKLLTDAIKNSSAKVVLGYFFQMDSKILSHIEDKTIHNQQKNIRSSKYKFAHYSSEQAHNVPFIEAIYPQANINEISNASSYSGFFNMIPDRDGVVRSALGIIKFQDALYVPLSLMSVSAFVDDAISVNIDEYGVREIKIGNLSAPTDELGRIMVNYRGGAKTFPHISITDILNKKISDNAIKNKIVMIGATAIGIYDMRATPFENVFPGIEIHANIADSILAQDFLRKPAWAGMFNIMAIVFAGFFLSIALPRIGVVVGAVMALLLFLGYITLCIYLFSKQGFVLNLVYPLLMIIFTYLSITVCRYFMETRQKNFIKNAFSTYLAPSVVKQIIESPDKLALGGEERDITAFFSDIQGFTGISEKLQPKELVEILNEFLTEMTDIILKHKGTVDKFEGDAIIAFFGAPNELENHALSACKACIEMQKKLTELRAVWKKNGKPELKMRIGLCSGLAVVGNMGSKNRMDYTMMGDTVNTAARLESINKIYGIYTLISESTGKAAGNNFAVREIDSINVVGKKEPVTIYQIIDACECDKQRLIETSKHYEMGLKSYKNRDWKSAFDCFTKALDIMPNDGPSKTMQSRCSEFMINPPNQNWNGAFAMSGK